MNVTPRGAVLESFGHLFGGRAAAGRDDADLLGRFLSDGDEAAFETLVGRHGPLVLHVCRKYLANPDDVADAFQATFLVLIKRAPGMRDRRLLGNWLYGVATRVAKKARSRAWTDRARLGLLEPDDADPIDHREGPQPDRMEDHRTLHEEVARLPAKYRSPIVLCYLEGRTHEEAAEKLRWPVGTVRGRLHRARELLRRRLTQRGLPSPVPLLTLALRAPREELPRALVEGSVRAARAAWAGSFRTLAAGSASAHALELARGVTGPMFLSFWKTPLLGVATLGAAIGGGALAYQQDIVADAPTPAPVAAASAPASYDPNESETNRNILRARLQAKKSELRKAEAQAELAKATRARLEKNHAAGAVSAEEWDRAVAEAKIAEAECERVAAELQEAEIRIELSSRTAAVPARNAVSVPSLPGVARAARAPGVDTTAAATLDPLSAAAPSLAAPANLAAFPVATAAPAPIATTLPPSARASVALAPAASPGAIATTTPTPRADVAVSFDAIAVRLTAIEDKLDRILEALDAAPDKVQTTTVEKTGSLKLAPAQASADTTFPVETLRLAPGQSGATSSADTVETVKP